MILERYKLDYGKKTETLEEYRKRKIEMMQRDFEIELTSAEINKINRLETEFRIDRYCRDIMRDRWKEKAE